MSNPATAAELAAVTTAKTNLQTASTGLAAAKATAQTALDNAQAAATAANEVRDLSAVTTAIATANTATASTAKTLALATIEAAAQGNTATATSPSVADYAAAGVTVDPARLASMNDALNDADVKAINVNSTGSIQTLVNGYNAVLMSADGTAGNAGSSAPLMADYAAIGVNNVSSTASASLLSNWVDGKNTADVNTVPKLQAKADSVKVIMDIAALSSPTAPDSAAYLALKNALANLGITGVNDNNVSAVWLAIRDGADSGNAVDSLSEIQTLVNNANDAPVLVTGTTLAYTENGAAAAINTAITVSDADNATLTKATVKITAGYVTGQDLLSFAANSTTMGNITGNLVGDTMTLTSAGGTATILQWQTALRAVSYSNSSDAPSTAARTVSYVINDGTADSTAVTSTINVTAVNDAPVLQSATYALPNTPRSGSNPVGTVGDTISNIVTPARITDADGAAVPEGIAVTLVDTSRGTLWYSTNNGSNWTEVTATISTSNALLLKSDTRIFFKPTTGSTNTQEIGHALKFVAWDQTTGTEGSYVDISAANATGGTTAFSLLSGLGSNEAWLKQVVTPVVIDVNRDGVLSYNQVVMDVDGDGHLDQTAWAGAQDGVLVWDKLGDAKVHDNSQYAFSQYGAAGSTDLQGLAAGFDTNHDGVFNAADANFGEFKVWQDTNQNGVSDAGEMHSLADAGIASINLISDGVVRTPVDGVTEAGRTTATATDGSRVLMSDAGFAFSALAYSVDTVAGLGAHIDLLGSNMHLDLSSIVALHSNVAAVDLTGTGANSLKLNLSDVLGTAATNGVHTLTLTGDANDTVDLNMNEWTNTGNTVAQGEHTYAVYNASSDAAAQLLIDQHMVLANHG
jgi:hypothetical protein